MSASRNTKQRSVILEELRRLPNHPSAPELYERVRSRLPRISLGTVYRNLELLARRGEIRKLDGHGSGARFDGDPHDHGHLQCVACGAYVDVPAPALPVALPGPPAPRDPEILGVRIEYVGLCARCRARLGPERVAELRKAWM